MMARPPVASEVLQALERVPGNACGALVRKRADGTMAGALLVERGRVCWAMSQRYPLHLTDILVEEQDNLTVEQLDELFAMCRRDHMPLGETLVARGLVSLTVLHRALLRHTCEALDFLIRDEASPWAWVEHAGYGYHPMLTFSPAEVVTGVRALSNPPLAARAAARLAEVVRPGQRGFAIERTRGAKVPMAQLGCEVLELATLADLALQADEVMGVAATVDIQIALAELGELACASWIEDGLLFVLLCDGELALTGCWPRWQRWQSTPRRPMATSKEALAKLMEIDGVLGACIVDSNSGMMLGSIGGGAAINLELAAAGNTEVVRAKRKTMKSLNLSDPIEDILITLGRQYHLLRPLASNDALFIYLALDRSRANLALARHQLHAAEKDLTV